MRRLTKVGCDVIFIQARKPTIIVVIELQARVPTS